jgi:N-formylglutamate amidohydrolase
MDLIENSQDLVVKASMPAPRPPALKIVHPTDSRSAMIVACPHSGRFYPPELLAHSKLDPFSLRRSEDAFVDTLFSAAPTHGAVLVTTDFARAFVDLNRAETELDPDLIEGLDAVTPSVRAEAGLGVIPRTVGDGIMIYTRKISQADANSRLGEIHRPWHEGLTTLLQRGVAQHGRALLLDCHSMPNGVAGLPANDIVLGDRFGASCAPHFMAEAMALLQAEGLKVARNNPYAGGYSTQRHGKPALGQHALQIEINRSLYMVEGAFTLRQEFAQIQAIMGRLVARLSEAARAARN